MLSSSELNEGFSIDSVLSVVDHAHNYPVIEVSNPHASAAIALHGGQVLHYQPAGEDPVLWLSKDAIYAPGNPVRGGIPICWPWFGVHPEPDMASHGFVRNRPWELQSTEQLAEDATRIVLSTQDDEHSRSIWPHSFELQLTVTVGATLSLALSMTNRSISPVTVSAALHSYFKVGNIADVVVRGLENVEYIDALQNGQRFVQSDPVSFDAELDRIYQKTSGDEYITDGALQREIRLKKTGSHSTVVWNPWIEKSSRMSDFEEDGYQQMLCVETGNMGGDVIDLLPGASHLLGVEIGVQGTGSAVIAESDT